MSPREDVMRGLNVRLWTFVVLLVLAAAGRARADVCVSVDEAHDTLAPADRVAAVLVLSQQFEAAGQRVSDENCSGSYLVSHVRLGSTIIVTLVGPSARREGTAIGLEDLPALYNQMVRSILSGQPMGSMDVIDRTNVTSAQDLPPKRIQSDGFWYARLGYGGTFADRTYGAPALGFGYRGEFDAIGVDVSFFNYAWHSSNDYTPYYGSSPSSFSGSLLKLEGMYFTNTHANSTPYFGGGVSWGSASLDNGTTHSDGSGLQGEVTAGYEIGRATSVKFFVQADAILPFYEITSQTFNYQRPSAPYGVPTVTTAHRYAPSLVVSFGIGGRRGRR